jgi:hypothetical protein
VATSALVGGKITDAGLVAAARAAAARIAIVVELLDLRVVRGAVPTARARARIRIVDPTGAVVFDRQVRTDTLVGRKQDVAADMAVYAGRQLADVVRARMFAYRTTGANGAKP